MISEKTLLAKHYKILNQMKPGTGANVFLVEHIDSHEKRVLKFSFVEEDKRNQFEEEMSHWKRMNEEDEHIVLLNEFFFDGSNACIVMEYCEGGDLETLLKKRKKEKGKFSEKEIIRILSDVLQGLRGMHKLKIIHRDIKPGNILICKDGVHKLGDFNVSRLLSEDDGKASTMTGTILYCSPEMVDNESYSFSSDIYSVGAVIYELMTLTNAFTSLSRIVANQYVPVNPQLGYSDELVDLTRVLMAKNPSTRPTATTVLRQPFVFCALLQADLADMQTTLRTQQAAAAKREAAQDAEITQLKKRVAAVETENSTLQGKIARLTSTRSAPTSSSESLPSSLSTPSSVSANVNRSLPPPSAVSAAVPASTPTTVTAIHSVPQPDLGEAIIKIGSARVYEHHDVVGDDNTYCVVKIGSAKKKTRTILNTQKPVWNETFVFVDVSSEDVDNVEVSVFVFDDMLLPSDDLIGTGHLSLTNYTNEQQHVSLPFFNKYKEEGVVELDVQFQMASFM